MKKIICFAAILLVVAVSFSMTKPSYTATNAIYDFGVDTTISSASGFDTIAATSDTAVLFTYRPLKRGQEAFLNISVSGTVNCGSNPIYIEALVYNTSRTLMYSVVLDSIVLAAAGTEFGSLKVGTEVIGDLWTLRLRATADPGTVGIDKVHLSFRKAVVLNKNY